MYGEKQIKYRKKLLSLLHKERFMKVGKEYYGSDADGSRGVWIDYIELEDSDKDSIKEYLIDNFPECWYEPKEFPFPDEVTVYIDGYEFDINPKDWL